MVRVNHDVGLDKSGYQVNIFLISPRKHMLWALIRSASNEYPQNTFSWGNKENINTFGLKKNNKKNKQKHLIKSYVIQ